MVFVEWNLMAQQSPRNAGVLVCQRHGGYLLTAACDQIT